MTSGRQHLLVFAAVSLLAAGATAQVDREKRFLSDAADKLDRNAQSWFKVGFVQRAKRIWREVVTEYDPEHEASWHALGYMHFGTTWVPDESKPYPEADYAPPSRRRSLEKKWDSLAAKLARDHVELAQEFAEAGAEKRSRYHARRALRFVPDDAKAGALLGEKTFDGIFGEPSELRLLERSRQLRDAVAFLAEVPFEVEVLPEDATQPALERAGVFYRGVRSAHFSVWGDLPVTQLQEAARWAERSLWLCRAAFGGRRDYRTEPVLSAHIGMFRETAVWKQIVESNRDMFDADYLRFLLENCRAVYLNEGTDCFYVANEDSHDRVFDQVVRVVARDLAAMRTAGLEEGVGHAVVAMFFGRNLVYTIGKRGSAPEGGNTVSGGGDDEDEGPLLLPDMEEWKRIAIDQAWSGEAASIGGLPLVRPDQFSVVDRVKAWAVCDYLLRRDPDLLRALDQAAEGSSTPHDVAGTFVRLTEGQDLAQLEADWRRFWTEATRLLEPATSRPPAKPSSLEKKARPWFEALNRLRLRCRMPPVGWVRWEDPALKDLAKALKKSAPPPADLAALARRTLALRGKPSDAAATWLARPDYRDAVLDPDASVFGYAESGGLSLFEVRPVERPGSSVQVYPFEDFEDVPTQVDVSDLEPGLAKLLADRGHAELSAVGYPITLHCRALDGRALAAVQCLVRCDDEKVDGIVHVSEGGLATFYPLAPLKSGADVVVTWSWNAGDGPRRERETRFRTL